MPTLLAPVFPVMVVLLALAALTRAAWWIRQRLEQKPAAVPSVDLVNQLLPQTQCGQCGYPGCRPYAEAIVAGQAINRCPPGGPHTISKLAVLTGRPATALDTRHGWHLPARVAVIREAECIGCTKCIQACPVDAIVGAPKRMHTVISRDCTGCDLCVEPCPVDCIDMVSLQSANLIASSGSR
jgi:electron transport complex protein RnfB